MREGMVRDRHFLVSRFGGAACEAVDPCHALG